MGLLFPLCGWRHWQVGTPREQWGPRRWRPCQPWSLLHQAHRQLGPWKASLNICGWGGIQIQWLIQGQCPLQCQFPVPKQSFVFGDSCRKAQAWEPKSPGFKSQVTDLLCEPTIDTFLLLFMSHSHNRVPWSFFFFFFDILAYLKGNRGKRVIWGPEPQRKIPSLEAVYWWQKRKTSGTELGWCVWGLFY